MSSKTETKAINSGEPWIEAEQEFLKKNFRSMAIAKIADRLGRTENAVRTYAYQAGLRKQWTEEEDDILRANYPRIGDRVAGMLPLRTKGAIQVRAWHLGLRWEFRGNEWSESELTILKQQYGVYPTEQVAKKIGRSVSAIHAKIHRLKLEHKNDD